MRESAIGLLREIESLEWHTYSHAYGVATDVPAILAALLDEDDSVAESGLGDFVQRVLHQGSLYSATPVAAGFVASMLRLDAAAHPRHALTVLAETLGAAREALSATRRSLPRARRAVAVYEACATATPSVQRFLADESAEIRDAAAMYLENLDPADWWQSDVAFVVLDAFGRAAEDDEKSRLLEALAAYLGEKGPSHYLRDERGRDLVSRAHGELVALARDVNASARLRLAALRALVPLRRAFQNTRLDACELPSDRDSIFLELVRARHHGRATYRDVDFQKLDAALQLVLADALLDAPFGGASARTFLRSLLDAASDLTPDEAHSLGLRVLDFACERLAVDDRSLPFWKYDSRSPDGAVYALVIGRRPTSSAAPGSPSFRLNGKALVATLVDCDRFWERPTNALSFFFGLPDDREALRAMVG